jgi:hypothetical protein
MEQHEHNRHKFTINDDGTISVTTPEGRQVHTKPRGDICVSFDQITSIGVNNIVDIVSYNLVEHQGVTLHNIVFRDGGIVSLGYDSNGKLQKLATNHVNVSISRRGEVVYSMI